MDPAYVIDPIYILMNLLKLVKNAMNIVKLARDQDILNVKPVM